MTLVSLVSCADKNSGFSTPSGPDSTSQGGDPNFGGPGVDDPTRFDPGDSQNATDSSGTPVSSSPHDGKQDPPEPVPEPSTILLFGLGLTGLAVYRRRRRDEERKASVA